MLERKKGLVMESENHPERVSRAVYTKPSVTIRALTLITHGGSPTSGDSGGTEPSGNPINTDPTPNEKRG